MRLEATYLIKLAALSREVAGLNQGIGNSTRAFNTLEFDHSVSMLREQPDKFADKWWGKQARPEPDAAELARDLQGLLKPLEGRGQWAAALQVMADAASRKAAELLIPQGIGSALSRIPYSIH